MSQKQKQSRNELHPNGSKNTTDVLQNGEETQLPEPNEKERKALGEIEAFCNAVCAELRIDGRNAQRLMNYIDTLADKVGQPIPPEPREQPQPAN